MGESSNRTSYIQVVYDDAYKENAFYVWFKAGQPPMSRLAKLLLPTKAGKSPKAELLAHWCSELGWNERADALNAMVSMKLDDEVISERVKMLRDHAKMGRDVADKGFKYLVDKGFESDSAALRGIVEGLKLERENKGIADSLGKVLQMSEAELDREIKKLMTGKEDEILDADAQDVSPDASPEIQSE